MSRGEVWWVELADAGRRPACVVTRDAAIPVLTTVVVAPATRTIRGIPSEVALGRGDGMPTDCALSLDNLTALPKALLTERIAMLRDSKLDDLCRALRAATGC